MTAVVGALCTDGVVLGTDSAATLVQGNRPTVVSPIEKIAIVGDSLIVAGTGAVGLAQRFVRVVQNAHTRSVFTKLTDPMSIGKRLTTDAHNDFGETSVTPGRFGALLACCVKGEPALIEFDVTELQPELKTTSMWYCSMGSSQSITDSFMALMRSVFWPTGQPSVSEAAFVVTWALQHTIDVNPGGVSGPARVAVLRCRNGSPVAEMLDDTVLDDHRELIADAKDQLGEIKRTLIDGADAPAAPRLPD